MERRAFPIQKIDNDLSAMAAFAHGGHQIAGRLFQLHTRHIEWRRSAVKPFSVTVSNPAIALKCKVLRTSPCRQQTS